MGIGWSRRKAALVGALLAAVLLAGIALTVLHNDSTSGPSAGPGVAPTSASPGPSDSSSPSPSASPSRKATSPSPSASASALPAGPAPIGTGWTEIFPKTQLDHPPGLVRYSLTDGENHFWVLATDPSEYPGRDSGPRSELRFFNDYTSGQAQFQADIKVMSGCYRASIMQVFGAPDRATAFMAWAMPNELAYYSGQAIYAPLYDRYVRLNVVHDTATGAITVYVDGVARGTFQDHGAATHYFKLGVYHQKGMSDRCDVYARNIHVYKR